MPKLCANCNTRPCHREANGQVHLYCGRACANAAISRQTARMCVRCGIKPAFVEAGRIHQYCGKACRDQAHGMVVPAQRTVPLDERGPHALLPHEIRFYEKNDDFYEFTNFWECDKLVIDGQRWRTTEHYFQAMKFAAFPQLVDQCRNLATPRECFEMVRDPALKRYLLCDKTMSSQRLFDALIQNRPQGAQFYIKCVVGQVCAPGLAQRLPRPAGCPY